MSGDAARLAEIKARAESVAFTTEDAGATDIIRKLLDALAATRRENERLRGSLRWYSTGEPKP